MSSKGCSCFHLPSCRSTWCRCMLTCLTLCEFWGSRLRSLHMCSRYFTHGSIFQPLVSILLKGGIALVVKLVLNSLAQVILLPEIHATLLVRAVGTFCLMPSLIIRPDHIYTTHPLTTWSCLSSSRLSTLSLPPEGFFEILCPHPVTYE